jgi:hypothetical protein
MSKRPNTSKNQSNITDFTKRTNRKNTPIGTRLQKQNPVSTSRDLNTSAASARNTSRRNNTQSNLQGKILRIATLTN